MNILKFIRTLPARFQAARLNWAFYDCPVCGDPFSVQTVWGIPYAARLLTSPTEGLFVCAKQTCQDEARTRNRDKFGRDLFDEWPKGVRIEGTDSELTARIKQAFKEMNVQSRDIASDAPLAHFSGWYCPNLGCRRLNNENVLVCRGCNHPKPGHPNRPTPTGPSAA